MDDTLVIQWTIIGVGGGQAVLVVAAAWAVVRLIKAEMRAEISELRAEMNTNDAQSRADMNAHVSRLETAISGLQQQIVAIRQMLARFALHRHGDDGLPMAPLTDTLDPPEGTGNSNGDGNG